MSPPVAAAIRFADSGGFVFHAATNAVSNNKRESNMKVLLISNDAGGFAHHVDVPSETTVEQMFERHIGTFNANNYLIRVNRQPAAANQRLRDGDRVSFTPLKIEGAR